MSNPDIKNIDELLQRFVSTDEERPKFMKPWRERGYICASETHILIRVNGALSDADYPIGAHNIGKLFPTGSTDGKILFADLATALAAVPLVDEMDGKDEEIECEECDGTGSVYWDYRTWSRQFDCPVCDGDGYVAVKKAIPTGRKTIDRYATVTIGGYAFGAFFLNLILEAMKYCGCKEATVTFGAPQRATQFNLTGDIDIILMPLPEGIDICASIPVNQINK